MICKFLYHKGDSVEENSPLDASGGESQPPRKRLLFLQNTWELEVMVSSQPVWAHVMDLIIKLLRWGGFTAKAFLSHVFLTGKYSNSPRLRKILFTPLGSDSGIVSKYCRARTSNKPASKTHVGETVQRLRLKINEIKPCAHYYVPL